MKPKEIWKSVLSELEMSVSASNYATWIRGLTIAGTEEVENGEKVIVTIQCPSPYHQQRIEKNYQGQISKVLSRLMGKGVELKYVIGESVNKKKILSDESPLFATRSPGPIGGKGKHNLNPRLTFESYVVGQSNNFAYAAAQGVAKSPGTRHNPLFIYGGVGLGKTHLMHAIGHEIYKQHPDWNIMYLSAETFGGDLIASLQNKKVGAFKKKYRAPNVLLIDDVQFIAGKEYTQEEFFHTFNELYMSERQIVLTSDRPPQEIQKLEERLSSRFMGGVMVDIQLPDFETRVAILNERCKALGVAVQPEAIAMIAERSATNIRELQGILQGILTKARPGDGEIDGDFVRECFGSEKERRTQRVRPTRVISKTAQYYEYKVGELTGKSRRAPLVKARHTAMYLLYSEFGVPYEQVGRMFGGRDHTTVMHAVRKVSGSLRTDPGIAKIITDIKHGL
jgi:chromosomal replication initiator protein